MIQLTNTNIQLFKHSGDIYNKVTIITAKLEDQSYETLMHIGKGKMFSDPSVNALKYKLNESIDLYLWLQ